MTYEEVCELALALGVWLESVVAASLANQPPADPPSLADSPS
jgi:hypothetical protein